MGERKFTITDIDKMSEDDLRTFVRELYNAHQEDIGAIRNFQMRCDAQAEQIMNVVAKRDAILKELDRAKLKLDVYKQFLEDLLDKIMSSKGL